jgi:all-trans-retinol 13,14-reductase
MRDDDDGARPWSKDIPEGPWDYVVIGSGMGGMTTAALLAKLGRRVLVLEQHYVPGGFTHMFKRPGYRWDVGVHAVGELPGKTVNGRVLSALPDGQLEWASLGRHDRSTSGRLPHRLPGNPAELRKRLIDAFPSDMRRRPAPRAVTKA